MSTHYLGQQVPDGAVLAHTMWGEPADRTESIYVGAGIMPAPDTGVEYIGDLIANNPGTIEAQELVLTNSDRSKRCAANDNTCNGWRMKDSEFCAGHARKA